MLSHPHRIDWSLTALLVIQVISLFIAVPLGTDHAAGHLLLDLCRLLYAAVCIAALTRHRALQGLLIVALLLILAGPSISGSMLARLGLESGASLRHGLIETAAFGFNIAVTVLLARHVFGPGRVTSHRVRGGVLIYLNIASIFAIAYNAILATWPGALILTTGGPLATAAADRLATLTYFSLTTLTTTGYGDVVPVQPLARSLANLEAVIGQLFPATLLARIVALNIAHTRDDEKP